MDSLVSLLRVFKNRTVLLVNISGNYGDFLLQMGFKKILEQLGVKYVEIEPFNYIPLFNYYALHLLIKLRNYLKSFNLKVNILTRVIYWTQEIILRKALIKSIIDSETQKVAAIMIHGSGTLSDITPTKLALFRSILNSFKRVPVIVAPQSYWFPYTDFKELVGSPTQDVFLFCREPFSYSLLLNLFKDIPNVHVLLSPDTAFYLSRQDFFKQESERESFDALLSLRSDKESIIPDDIKYAIISFLHKKCKHLVVKDVGRAGTFNEYVNFIKNAKIIISDRLHVAILGAILGKEVFLLSNVYHKNLGIYMYSLFRFPNVRFYDAREVQSLLKDLNSLLKTN